MKKSILTFLSLVILLVTGCSVHRVSLDEGVSKSAIYQMDETELFNLVYSSIQEVFPQEKISTITQPARGYITKYLAPPLHIDGFTQKVLIHRASGIDGAGKNVYGYWVEVSGSGSSFLQGNLKNEELFNTILSNLENTAKKHIVSNVLKAPYLLPQENFYVRNSDALEGERVVITNKFGGSDDGASKAEQLRELHQLKVDGIINDEEYERVKRKILEKY